MTTVASRRDESRLNRLVHSARFVPVTKYTDDAKAATERIGRCNKKSLYTIAAPWIPAPCRASKPLIKSTNTALDSLTVNDNGTSFLLNTCNRNIIGKTKSARQTDLVEMRAKADLEAARNQLRNQKAELARSRELLEDHEDELVKTKTDLNITSKVNNSLRRSMEFLRDETMLSNEDDNDVDEIIVTERDILETERQLLSKKLLDLEFEGSEASNQMSVLRDTLNKLKEDKRMSSSDISLLNKQRSLLLDKLAAFETSNRALRHILREHARKALEAERISDQRDTLLTRLTESDNKLSLLREELNEKDVALTSARTHYDSSKADNESLMNHSRTLEQTKGHLQKQLRSREADCNRMAVQIRSLESKLEQDRLEMDHLHALVRSTKRDCAYDRCSLSECVNVQKNRASTAEVAFEKLTKSNKEKESQAAELHSVVEQLRSKLVTLSKDKGHLEAENAHLLTKLSEVESTTESVESNARHRIDRLTHQAHEKESLILQLKAENERLKVNQVSLEDRILGGNTEVTTLRSTNNELDSIVDDLRTQLDLTRRENQELNLRLEQSTKDIARLQHDHLVETEKAEQAHLEVNRQHTKFIQSHEDNIQLAHKVEALERKVKELEEDNQDLIVKQAKGDENSSQLALTVEEKSREIAALSRQLDISIQDGKRAAESAQQKISTKERNSQARLMELEAQLGRAKAELSQVRRAKDDNVALYNKRLEELRSRLDKAVRANASMQQYLALLKKSYASTFPDCRLSIDSVMSHEMMY